MNIVNGTLPHQVIGKFAASKVIIKPAKPGTGVIAGSVVRIMLEALGLKDVVAKSLGSRNSINTIRAVVDALSQCRHLKNEEFLRGKKLPVFFHGEVKISKKKSKKEISEPSSKVAEADVKCELPNEIKKTKERV